MRSVIAFSLHISNSRHKPAGFDFQYSFILQTKTRYMTWHKNLMLKLANHCKQKFCKVTNVSNNRKPQQTGDFKHDPTSKSIGYIASQEPSLYYVRTQGWVGGPENGNFSLLYVVKISLRRWVGGSKKPQNTLT